ncbi:iron-hydroxamate ABC transporter substrate-binding protein [Alicyclobacillus contaminans]|uniref:iron-hydroxamate ABC transporter substrate-binding protein n=1 Tax=Alicyclobacillus contaminans TaxID=392016 RepID=UPI000688BEE7|nr:iron-hydroxamate ABC transporter substrate-binding protein [Alicyclobacillus contaminans]
MLLVSACGVTPNATQPAEQGSSSQMVTYQSENGPVQVPAHPKRVVVLSTFDGDVLALGVHLVGVDPYAKADPLFKDRLKDATVVSDDDLDKIMALKPDLIIGLSSTKNVDRLKQIAPTVTYTYGKLDYLTQFEEIGKLLGKEAEAKAWVANYKKQTAVIGEQIRAKIGPKATVSVIEASAKQLWVFGDNWGRGTEILYQAMKLNMPEKVKETALKQGYYQISPEVLPEFFGDYVILSKMPGEDTSFQNTETYKNIPAVKQHHVFEVNASVFSFNDPISLDYELNFIKKSFLGT